MTHTVVYRTGGTENFTWHRSSAMAKADALAKRDELERMGYPAMVERYDVSMALGLPEGYTYRVVRALITNQAQG